jgi:hypothetical protein
MQEASRFAASWLLSLRSHRRAEGRAAVGEPMPGEFAGLVEHGHIRFCHQLGCRMCLLPALAALLRMVQQDQLQRVGRRRCLLAALPD